VTIVLTLCVLGLMIAALAIFAFGYTAPPSHKPTSTTCVAASTSTTPADSAARIVCGR
jgi:hypothetical protein